MTEAVATLRIAAPLMMLRLSAVSIGFVDAIVAGQLGAESLGALSLASATWFLAVIFAQGTLTGIEPVASRALGAGDAVGLEAARRGAWAFAAVLAPPLMLVVALAPMALVAMGQPAALMGDVTTYMWTMAGSLPLALLFFALSSYQTAIGSTSVFVVISLVVAVLNGFLDVWFAFGGFGLAPMGVPGLGLASAICNGLGLLLLIVLCGLGERPLGAVGAIWRSRFRPAFREMVRMGLPFGSQYALEAGGFTLVTLFMGLKGTTALAAHQVAMNSIAISFAMALALSSAASARVGHAMGRRDALGADRAGRAAFALGIVVALGMSCLIFAFRHRLSAWMVDDVDAARLAAEFLVIAMVFQLADVTQAIGFGVHRGFGDVLAPLFFNIGAYWLLGMPMGYTMAIARDGAPHWLWWALCLALFLVACALLVRFRVLVRRARLEFAGDSVSPDAL